MSTVQVQVYAGVETAQTNLSPVEHAYSSIMHAVAKHLAKDIKAKGESTTIGESLNYLQRELQQDNWEQVEWVHPHGEVQGSALFKNDRGDIITIPASKWRRESVYTTSPTGGLQLVDAHERLPESEEAEETEISFLALEEDTPERAADLAKDYLTRLFTNNEAILKGPEFEFSVEGKDVENFLNEALKELSQLQREKDMEPSNGNFDNKVLLHIAETLREANAQNIKVNFASTHPAAVDFRKEGNQVLKHPYVHAVTAALDKYIIKPNMQLLRPEVREAWEDIATNLGFQDLDDLMKNFHHMDYWLANCYHVSNDQPTYTETGKGSEVIFKNCTNLLVYFRNLIDGLCYSGGTTFDTPIKHNGKLVADGRAIIRNLMPSSNPANLLKPDTSVHDQMVNAVMEGRANVYDRASVTTTVASENENGKVIADFMSLHGDVRWRVAIPYKNYVAYRKAMDLASSQEHYPNLSEQERDTLKETIAHKFGERVRLEYTSRPATPDMRKYLQSVAMQDICVMAGIVASMEGENDVFRWLESNDINMNIFSPDVYVWTDSLSQYDEMLDTLHGDFPENKIEQFFALAQLLDEKLTEHGFGDGYHPLSQALAAAGLDSLRAQSDKSRMTGLQRFDAYLRDSNSEHNWGELVNALEDQDIDEILREYFDYDSQELSRGQKILVLNHHLTDYTCAWYGVKAQAA